MKITIVAVTALFAAASPFALAQEDSPSPAASPEMTTTEKSTSDPSVSVTTEKTASPAPKSKASPSPKSAASPSPSKSSSPTTKPSPGETPSNSPAADMPTKKSTPEATIRDIEDKWVASVKNHDTSMPQAYLADDFRGVSSKGKLMKKSDVLSENKKDTDVYSSTKNGKVDVRVFNGQFAVATGVTTEVGKDKTGQPFKRSFRWTDVWVLRKDKWQCVALQAMLVE